MVLIEGKFRKVYLGRIIKGCWLLSIDEGDKKLKLFENLIL